MTNPCSSVAPVGGSVTVHSVYTVAHPYLQYFRINVRRQGGTNLVAKDGKYSDAGNGTLWTDTFGEHGTETRFTPDFRWDS